MDGVLDTESLWFGRKEGVRVTYDREQVSFDALLQRAARKKCDLFVWTSTDAQLAAARKVVGKRAQPFAAVADRKSERRDKEQQYYLYKSPLRFVPMTVAQRTRINAAIRSGGGYGASQGKAWRRFLSPRQLEMLQAVEAAPKKKWPVAQGVPLSDAIGAFLRVSK